MIHIFQSTRLARTASARSFPPSPWRIAMGVTMGLLVGCAADRPLRTPDVSATVRADLLSASMQNPLAFPPAVPSGGMAQPAVAVAPEPRLDLLVNNAQAREVFLALVADTRYSMLMHPDVAGTLSVTLRGVTVVEALEAIRDVYGYDFKMEGRRITIYAPTLQTRIFTVNYPQSQRVGSSELRVSPGSALQSSAARTPSGLVTPAAGSAQQIDGSRVLTTSKTDFWTELTGAVRGLVGSAESRNVVASPQAGIMAVRAMPDELRQVEKFLKAAQIAVERQVMLEAKIVEVELRDSFQSGIDWSSLRVGGGSTSALGVLSGNTGSNTLVNGNRANLPGFSANSTAAVNDGISLPSAGAGLFGLAFATTGFQAVLGFLETQGDVQILSSPRIATLNNQKAILKVGVEDFFVTNVSGGTVAASIAGATGGTTLPSLTLTPFFSGISLDVTPQIDEGSNISLHVHPSVTIVTEKTKQIDLGSIGSYRLPLASSSVNESDTVVKIQDSNIVAIGGLMQIESNRRSSGLPGTSDIPVFAPLFGNRANTGRKKEVVVLIKPTIIRTAQDWDAQNQRARGALDDMDAVRARVIRIDGTVDDSKAKSVVK